ncbi:MAG TPA: DUF4349 domain-containing protein [Polyangiaceae bacterium]|nr:DUF4349 domain-containing protein [Polyangiaceae bacterium]
MTRPLYCALLVLFAWLLAGCGASQSKYAGDRNYDAESAPMSAGAAAPMEAEADYDGDAVADSDDASVYREEISEPTSISGTAHAARVAQTSAPAPGAPGPAQPAPPQPAPPPQKPDVKPTPEPKAQPSGGGGSKAKPAGENTIAAPMLIYTADVNLAVFEAEKILDSVERLAKDSGGYLVERQARRIVIRVPSQDFDGAMLQIAKLGDVLHKNVSVEDVTEQYFDLQVRIRNLQVVRDRLEELLKKADKVPDAIAVERELERVTTQLERLKGKAKLLGELVRFSTITVNVSPRHTDKVGSKVRLPFPWLNSLGLSELLRL